MEATDRTVAVGTGEWWRVRVVAGVEKHIGGRLANPVGGVRVLPHLLAGPLGVVAVPHRSGCRYRPGRLPNTALLLSLSSIRLVPCQLSLPAMRLTSSWRPRTGLLLFMGRGSAGRGRGNRTGAGRWTCRALRHNTCPARPGWRRDVGARDGLAGGSRYGCRLPHRFRSLNRACRA